MLSHAQLKMLRSFYNSLSLDELKPDNPNYQQYYVPYFKLLGQADPMRKLARQISWAEDAGVHLLSGQRGNGKTTELYRLQQLLSEQQDGNPPCVVFFCDINDYLNTRIETDPSAFLIAVMAGLNDAWQRHSGKDLGKRSYLARLTDFLNTEVDIDSMAVKAGGATIKTTLKADTSFPKQLDKALSNSGRYAQFVQEAHAFASEIAQLAKADSGDDDTRVVLIVDSMERAGGGRQDASATPVYESIRKLFTDEADKLRFPGFQVLYTVPPWLATLAPASMGYAGSNAVCSFPNLHVLNRHNGELHDDGWKVLKAITSQRFADWPTVLSEEQLKRLARSSGGDLRDFFRLLREVITRAADLEHLNAPVPTQILNAAEQALVNTILLTTEDKALLAAVHQTKTVEIADLGKLNLLVRLFGSTLVLHYRNGEDWYDVHPLLWDQLPKPEHHAG